MLHRNRRLAFAILVAISLTLAPTSVVAADGDHALSTAAAIQTPLGETTYPFADAVLSGPGDLDGISVHISSGHDSAVDQLSVGILPNLVTVDFDSSTGLLRMRGAASLANYQAAIRSITYRQSTPTSGSREFLLIPASTPYSTATGNLYQLVNVGTSITWHAARSAANAASLASASGHLVNITSQAENAFVMSLLGSPTWTGGTDEAAEGTWLWADGPEAGQQFWSGAQESSGGAAVAGMFDSWAASEPNNAVAGEDYIGVVPGSGLWLDYPASHGDVRTYTVEFEQSDLGDLLVRATLTIGPACVSPLTGEYANTDGAQGSIGRLYMATFGRQPDAGGFSYWTDRMDNGFGIWDIADFFAESPEFESTFGSPDDSGFVDHLYEKIMCRPGDATGKQFWRDQLASATLARTDILLLFADSPEFRELTVSD